MPMAEPKQDMRLKMKRPTIGGNPVESRRPSWDRQLPPIPATLDACEVPRLLLVARVFLPTSPAPASNWPTFLGLSVCGLSKATGTSIRGQKDPGPSHRNDPGREICRRHLAGPTDVSVAQCPCCSTREGCTVARNAGDTGDGAGRPMRPPESQGRRPKVAIASEQGRDRRLRNRTARQRSKFACTKNSAPRSCLMLHATHPSAWRRSQARVAALRSRWTSRPKEYHQLNLQNFFLREMEYYS